MTEEQVEQACQARGPVLQEMHALCEREVTAQVYRYHELDVRALVLVIVAFVGLVGLFPRVPPMPATTYLHWLHMVLFSCSLATGIATAVLAQRALAPMGHDRVVDPTQVLLRGYIDALLANKTATLLTDEEKDAHRTFLAEMTRATWKRAREMWMANQHKDQRVLRAQKAMGVFAVCQMMDLLCMVTR